MKVNLKEMNIVMNDMEVFGEKTYMKCHILPAESMLVKDIIIEAKVGIHEDTYNYLIVARYQLEMDDENIDPKELSLETSDYILPHLSLFIQILDEQIKTQENKFCA